MITQRHDYPHAWVELQFFIVTRWTGEIRPQEGQAVAWQTPGAYTVEPMLPALLTDDSECWSARMRAARIEPSAVAAAVVGQAG